jgi:formylglycine-generating enzyme required for sulfatase activity
MLRSLPFLTGSALLLLLAPASAGERYAFLVGVRQYDQTQLNSLRFPEQDVTRLGEVLQAAGYPKSNLVLMTQTTGAAETRFLPIARNIRKQLDLLLGEIGAEDSLLVAFSGHGVQFAGEDDSFFCPADAELTDRTTLIALGEVYQALSQCKAAVKVLLVDACRNDPVSTLAKSRQVVKLETVEKLVRPDPPGGIAALFSCSRGQQSFEHPELKHGIFFNFVINGLSGQADYDEDQEVSLAELELYAVKEVQRFARNKLDVAQTPERQGVARGLLNLARINPAAPPPLPIAPVTPGQVIENSLGMKLVCIAAGDFRMGSTAADVSHMQRLDSKFTKQYAEVELPQHAVRITRPFLMGVYEVTKGQFARFVQEQGYRTDAEQPGPDAGGFGYSPQGKPEGPKPQYSWRNTGFAYHDDHPVVNVSFNDAIAFCNWLSAKEKREYHLPTEAQWEYACRAGTQTLYYHDDDPESLHLVANVAAKGKKTFTEPVGQYRLNAFGLHDMHGNVQEWCADVFSASYYKQSPAVDPPGPGTGLQRVVRGGNFEIAPGYCRSANRIGRGPSGRHYALGFRVAVTLAQ